jgi:spore coat polysaccharide biosynthesis protein SpsF (cytidylyltransferase family)
MADILGLPSLGRICSRANAATGVDGVVVATSVHSSDLVIRQWAHDNATPCHAGSLENVLDRTLGAALAADADRIVFINGDSPLTDPRLIDTAIDRHGSGEVDYVSSLHGGGGYPDGYSVEVFSRQVLTEVAVTAGARSDVQEHVTIPFYDRPGNFRATLLRPLEPPPAKLHLSLDTEADLRLLRELYERLLPRSPHFGYEDVMDVLNGDAALLERATVA